MFDSLNDDKLRAAHDAARLLCENHRALGLDPLAIKLDTLRVDIAVELENRGKPVTTADQARPHPGETLTDGPTTLSNRPVTSCRHE